MKKQIQKIGVLIITFLLSVQLVSAQKADTSLPHPSNVTYEHYMHMHKALNTVGWLLLVPATALVIIGFTYQPDPNSFLDLTGAALAGVGGLAALTSIPFFIRADSYARKARKARFQLRSGTVPGPGKFNYVAVALKINL